MEDRIVNLTEQVERIDESLPAGLSNLRTILKSLDINEKYIQILTKKCLFEIHKEDLKNIDHVIEFMLREVSKDINIAMPLFSQLDEQKRATITMLISENSTGQTSQVYKLASLKNHSVVIRCGRSGVDQEKFDLVERVFNLEVVRAKSLPEVVTYCRKYHDEGRSVFVDYKLESSNDIECKSFIDGLKRSFVNVEILLTISSVHSDLYNRKILNKYQKMVQGLVVSYLDQCLEFGHLFNWQYDYKLPLVFFGTGPTIPEDIEAASVERMISGLFGIS